MSAIISPHRIYLYELQSETQPHVKDRDQFISDVVVTLEEIRKNVTNVGPEYLLKVHTNYCNDYFINLRIDERRGVYGRSTSYSS